MPKNILNGFITKAGAALLLLCLTAGTLPAVTLARVTIVEKNYVIQLSDAGNYGDILKVGSNLNRLFIGNSAAIFKNIYTFSSTNSLEDLRSLLKGEYFYLENKKPITELGVVVNDPGFAVDSQNIDKEWGLQKAGFTDAWQKSTGTTNNIVAVIDTGIDATHEDLRRVNYVPGFDFINKQPIQLGVNTDDNGHGTLVAGILGATANNGLGIVGTNWQITLMPIKALDSSGKGDAATLAEAIVWAADNGAQFINLSVGGIGFGHDTTLANAIIYAFNKNVVIVAAAGNDIADSGSNLDSNPVFPICDDNNYNMVIGVASVDQNDTKPDFSNYGKNCVDVTAPGKRILSTINYDPLTKRLVPNSYAYGSGTSLSVPFVVGQATLIKTLYPQATNIQIRDRIISTADPIDSLNLIQCAGKSCAGLLGAGRINVARSLQNAILQTFSEGDLVRVTDLNGEIYQIIGGQKRLVSPFVYNQRFAGITPKSGFSVQLAGFPEGPYVTPNEGTLVKFDKNPTVYAIQNGQKLPVSYQVFLERKFNFNDVDTLSYEELNSWTTANFLPPTDGTLIKSAKSKAIYWVVGQVLHPINFAFYKDRGLNIFPIMTVSDNDILSFPKGEAYIR